MSNQNPDNPVELTQVEVVKPGKLFQKETALKILDPEDGIVMRLTNEYQGLIITDPHDKDQIKVMANAAKIVRTARIDVNKKRKFIKDQINSFKSEIDEAADTMFTNLDTLYKQLKQRKDDALLIVQNEAEAAEKERMNAFNERATQLLNAGFLSNGLQYIAGTVIVANEELLEIPEDEFHAIIHQGIEELARIEELMKAGEKATATEPIEKEESGDPFDMVFPVGGTDKPPVEQTQVDDLPFDMPSNSQEQQPEPIPEKFEPIETPSDDGSDIKEFPEGFELGWYAHLEIVKEVFATAPPMRRGDLLDLIMQKGPSQ